MAPRKMSNKPLSPLRDSVKRKDALMTRLYKRKTAGIIGMAALIGALGFGAVKHSINQIRQNRIELQQFEQKQENSRREMDEFRQNIQRQHEIEWQNWIREQEEKNRVEDIREKTKNKKIPEQKKGKSIEEKIQKQNFIPDPHEKMPGERLYAKASALGYQDAMKYLVKNYKSMQTPYKPLLASKLEANKKLYSPIVDKYSKMYGVDPALMKKLIAHESGWNPDAVSKSGDVGLCQANFSLFASELSLEYHHNPLNPEQTIEKSTRFMANLLKKYNDKEIALTAYNMGETSVSKMLRNGYSKPALLAANENDYARKVLEQRG
ncbi:MAG: transglycosylase SLT domain-containing protein [archaeon]